MKDFGRIRSAKCPDELEIDEYSVYVNTDIEAEEVSRLEDGNITVEYSFCQKRYTKDEYIKLMDSKNNELEESLTNTQIALCELYESLE